MEAREGERSLIVGEFDMVWGARTKLVTMKEVCFGEGDGSGMFKRLMTIKVAKKKET